MRDLGEDGAARKQGERFTQELFFTKARDWSPESEYRCLLDQRYARDDFAAGWDDEAFASAVMIVVTIERWIAWADWD